MHIVIKQSPVEFFLGDRIYDVQVKSKFYFTPPPFFRFTLEQLLEATPPSSNDVWLSGKIVSLPLSLFFFHQGFSKSAILSEAYLCFDPYLCLCIWFSYPVLLICGFSIRKLLRDNISIAEESEQSMWPEIP